MTRHLTIASAAFTWAGALLGLPSLAALLYTAWALVRLRLKPSATPGAKPDYSSPAGLLVGGARLAGKAISLFTSGAEWAIAALAILSLLLVGFAILLFAVGRGLHAHHMWARILGMILASGLLLAGTTCALLLRQSLAAAAATVIAATSAYVIWTLWRQFV